MTEVFMAFLLTSAVGTALALFLMLLKPVTRKYFSASWHYYMWLVVLVVMMIPFKFNLPERENMPTVTVNVTEVKESEKVEKIIAEDIPQVSEITTVDNTADSPVIDNKAVPKKSVSVFQIIIKFLQDNITLFAPVWIVGAVLLFILKIARYKKFLKYILANSKETACPEIAEYTDENIEVRVSRKTQSPFVIRWMKPVLVLPDREITACELNNILAHEITHIKRHDILYKWAVNIVKCVHWFNPCVYIIGKEIDKDCEISCDVKAVKNMSADEKKAYADTILSLLSDKGQRAALTTGMSGDKKSLKERFEMIKNSKRITKTVLIVSVALVVVISVVTVFVSGILNGQLLDEEEEYRIHVNKPSEPIEINVISAADLKVGTYEKILEKYYKALSEKWDHNKMWDENLCYLAGLSKHTNPIENIGYCLMDVNGDNQDELLIGEISDGYWGMVIYDLYTIKNDEPYRILDSHERNRYILFEEDGVYKIANEGTESAAKAFTNYYAFDGSNLKLEKAVILDSTKTPESDQFTGFFVAYDDDFNIKNDTPIDQKTATEIMQSYDEKYITPKFLPFETLKEEAVPVTGEEAEKIIEKFYEAYDFWGDWIYGQRYRAYDDLSELSFGSSRESVTSESPIKSVAQLRAEMEKHFTKEMENMFFSQLVPEDKDGKLYIYCCDMADNGPWEDCMGVTVEKISDIKYSLKINIELFDGEGYTIETFNKYVYYILEDNKWVFENDEQNEFFYSWGVPEKYNCEEFEPYNEILKTYYAALYQKWDVERIEKYNLHDILTPFYENEPLKSVGYSFMDINADGQNELLIGKVNGHQDKIIWDMYTVKNGEPYRLFTSLERNRHYVFENEGKYMVANERHGSAMDYEYTYFTFDGEKLNTEKSIYLSGNLQDNSWYIDGEPIDEKSAMEITESYREKYISLKFIPFETLG